MSSRPAPVMTQTIEESGAILPSGAASMSPAAEEAA